MNIALWLIMVLPPIGFMGTLVYLISARIDLINYVPSAWIIIFSMCCMCAIGTIASYLNFTKMKNKLDERIIV